MLTKTQGTTMKGMKELVSVQEMMRRKWPKNKILGAIRAEFDVLLVQGLNTTNRHLRGLTGIPGVHADSN